MISSYSFSAEKYATNGGNLLEFQAQFQGNLLIKSLECQEDFSQKKSDDDFKDQDTDENEIQGIQTENQSYFLQNSHFATDYHFQSSQHFFNSNYTEPEQKAEKKGYYFGVLDTGLSNKVNQKTNVDTQR